MRELKVRMIVWFLGPQFEDFATEIPSIRCDLNDNYFFEPAAAHNCTNECDYAELPASHGPLQHFTPGSSSVFAIN